MLEEIPEAAAAGRLAEVYGEFRHFCGVPYVSSLQRYVATMPGCLEYAWTVCRPAFANGMVPETAWGLVSAISVAPLPPLSDAALRVLGVDREGAAQIHNICDTFVRVAPINLLFAGCVEQLFEGARPGGGTTTSSTWQPPEMLAPMPAMVDAETAGPDVNAVLLQLATEIGGEPFVPGLYRLLAHWPGYLAHAVTLLEPLLKSEVARNERAAIAGRIVAAADAVIAGLPSPAADLPSPAAEHKRAVVDAIRTYRVTSPEMIVFGMLMRDALPKS